jgi:hypothetical protein
VPQTSAVSNKNTPTANEEEIAKLLASGFFVSMADDLGKAKAGQLNVAIPPPAVPIPIPTPPLTSKPPLVSLPVKEVPKPQLAPSVSILTPPRKTEAEEFLLKQREPAIDENKQRQLEEAKRQVEELRKKQEADRLTVEGIKQKIEAEKRKQVEAELKAVKERTELPAVPIAVATANATQPSSQEEQKKVERERALMAEIKAKAQEEAQRKAKEVELFRLQEIEKQKQLAEQQRQQELDRLKQEQARRLAEEAERKRQEEQRQKVDVKAQLEQRQAEIAAELKSFPAKRRPLEAKRAVLLTQKEDFLKAVSSLVNNEEAQAKKRQEVDAQEKVATEGAERHRWEKERWLIEEKLRQIEREKWAQEEKLEVIEAKLKEEDQTLNDLAQAEGGFQKQAAEIAWKLKEIELKLEKEKIVKDSAILDQNLVSLNEEKNSYLTAKNKIDEKISEVLAREKEAEATVSQIEVQEKTAGTATEEKSLEKKRWSAEDARQKIEQERWDLETKQKTAEASLKDVDVKIQTVNKKMEALKERTIEIDQLLMSQGKPPELPKPKVEPQKAPDVRPQIILEVKKPEPPKPPPPEIKPQEPVKPPESKLPIGQVQDVSGNEGEMETGRQREQEIIKRAKGLRELEEEKRIVAEIRKSARQSEIKEKIAAIRAKATQIHQEGEMRAKGPLAKELILKKLTSASPKEEAEREEFLLRVAGADKSFDVKEKERAQEVVFRPVIRKPSFLEKFFTRFLVIIVLVVVLVGIFLVWQVLSTNGFKFNFRPSSSPNVLPNTTSSENVTPNPQIPTTTEPIITPTSTPVATPTPDLLSFGATKAIVFTERTEIPDLLKTLMAEAEPADSLIRILVQDSQTEEFLEIDEIFGSLGFTLKPELLDLLEPGSNLALYYGKKGPRLAFLVPTNDPEALNDFLITWEDTLPSDAADLLTWQIQSPVSFSGSFKEATNNNQPFRYLDALSTVKDIGICYSVVDDYFVFATAGSAMVKLLQILP